MLLMTWPKEDGCALPVAPHKLSLVEGHLNCDDVMSVITCTGAKKDE